MFNMKTNPSLENDKFKILNQNSEYLNKNPRQVNIAPLVRELRKDAGDITEYWVDLPPEFTSISQFIEPIILRLV